MKKILSLITLALLLTSCGPRNKTKYVENPYDDSGVKGRLSDIEARVAALESARLLMIADISTSQSKINALELGQAALGDSLMNLQDSVNSLADLTQDQVDALTARMDAVEDAISALESDSAANASAVASANSAINNLSNYVDSLVNLGTAESNYLRAQISALQGAVSTANTVNGTQGTAITTLQGQISSAQSTINSMSSQIVSLQNNMSITSIIDPCGDGAGFDEVLFKLSDGRLVASFSENVEGRNTRFSVLTTGSYVTTDGTNCHFSVNASNQVTW